MDEKQIDLARRLVAHDETWRAVVGWEGLYEVSDLGRVRSLDRAVRRRDGRLLHFRGKTLSPAVHKDHAQIALTDTSPGGRGKVTGHIHVLVLEAFVGPCLDGMECRHLDGDGTNNVLSNLRWGTRTENIRDRDAHGDTAIGERAGRARLTEAAVREARTLRASGFTVDQLAANYGVASNTMRSALLRLTWRHVV